MALGRPQSNVGARLLKKRQSVSYHTAVTEGMAGGPRGAPPPMPGMGSVPAALVPGGGQGGVGVGMGMPVPRAANQADDDLGRTGLDIDLLASEGFKPEDCESKVGGGKVVPSEGCEGLTMLRIKHSAQAKHQPITGW